MKNSRRQNRTRYKLKRITNRKRLSVFRSNKHIYAHVINDDLGITLASASSIEKTIEKTIRSDKNNRKELAEKIGLEIAKRSLKNGVKDVAFDKGKYKYHGIVKILADAARSAGLNF